MDNKSEKKKLYYGWIVAFCCTMLAFSVNAMGNNAISFYVVPVSETFGVNRATINLFLFTIGALSRTIFGFFFGKLTRQYGVKRLMIVAFIFVLSGYLSYSCADNIYMIGLGSALYGVAHAIGTLSSYNVIINNWYIKNKGIVLGILNTAVGAGGMVINPLVGNWIKNYGWNRSFLNTLLLISAIAIPALIFIKESPDKMGLQAWGAEMHMDKNTSINSLASSNTRETPVPFSRIMKTERFWLLVAILFLIGFCIIPSYSNTIPALYACNIDSNYITNTLAVLIPFGIVIGHLTSGVLYDRFGLIPLMTTAVTIVTTGMINMSFLTSFSSEPILILTVLCIGYGNAISLGTLSHIINNIFYDHKQSFSVLFGCLFAIQNVGSMIGSPVTGVLYDKTGNYKIAYQIAACLLIVMYILLCVTMKLRKRYIESTY